MALGCCLKYCGEPEGVGFRASCDKAKNVGEMWPSRICSHFFRMFPRENALFQVPRPVLITVGITLSFTVRDYFHSGP